MPSPVEIPSSLTDLAPPNGQEIAQNGAAAELAPVETPAAEIPAASPPASPVPAPSLIRSMQMGVIRRMILGLLFVLPIVLTVVVVYQIYRLLNQWVIRPMA